MMKIFKIDENKIMFKKDLNLSNQSRLAFSILNLFSYTLERPRILINSKIFSLSGLSDILMQNATVKVLKTNLTGIFSFAVNFCEFDLGIFIVQKKSSFELIFYSGSGYALSPAKTNNMENSLKNIKKTRKNVDFHIQNLKIHEKKSRCATMQKKETNKKLKNIFKIYQKFMKDKMADFIENHSVKKPFKLKKIYFQNCKSIIRNDRKILKKYFKFRFIKKKNRDLFFKIDEKTQNFLPDQNVAICFFEKTTGYSIVKEAFFTYRIKVLEKDFSDEYSLFKFALENSSDIYLKDGKFALFEIDFTFNMITQAVLLSILLT